MTRGAPSWTCPWCERVVPARETQCHCGCNRAVAEAKAASEAEESEGTGGAGRALLAVALVAMCGLVFYAALRQRMLAEDAAAANEQRRRGVSATPGPSLLAQDSASPVAEGYTPPAGWFSPPPRPTVPVAPVASPSPKATEAPSLVSSMEEEWEKASALLEPPLQKIAADSGALQASYERFASQCLAPDAAASGGSWLSAMRNAPLRPGIQVIEGGLDCLGVRETLVGRANRLRSELSTAADTARTNRVLPGHWRKLVAAHQLEAWEQY